MGSSPTSATGRTAGCSSMAEHRVAQWQSTVKSLTNPSSVLLRHQETHSTAVVKYMALAGSTPARPPWQDRWGRTLVAMISRSQGRLCPTLRRVP